MDKLTAGHHYTIKEAFAVLCFAVYHPPPPTPRPKVMLLGFCVVR